MDVIYFKNIFPKEDMIVDKISKSATPASINELRLPLFNLKN